MEEDGCSVRTGEVEDHVGDDCGPEGDVGTGELREAGEGYRDYEQDVDDLRRAEQRMSVTQGK